MIKFERSGSVKIKTIKNFYLFDGRKFTANTEYDIDDSIAIDLEKGKFVEIIASKKIEKETKTDKEEIKIVEKEEAIEDKKPKKTTRKKKAVETEGE